MSSFVGPTFVVSEGHQKDSHNLDGRRVAFLVSAPFSWLRETKGTPKAMGVLTDAGLPSAR